MSEDPIKPMAEYVLEVEREFLNSPNSERAVAVVVAEDTFSHVWNNHVHPLQEEIKTKDAKITELEETLKTYRDYIRWSD